MSSLGVADRPLSAAHRAMVDKLLRGDLRPSPSVSAGIRRQAGAAVPLSDAQRRIWLLAQLDPCSTAYNECYTVGFPAARVDPRAVERSLSEVIRRHAVWRTTFASVAGEPHQFEHPTGLFALRIVDLGHVDARDREAEAKRIASEDAARPFDLTRDALVRATLVSLSDKEHQLFFTLHHIVVDGVTFYRVFLPEFVTLYDAFRRGGRSPLPELPVQYADFACWRQEHGGVHGFDEQVEYWKSRLAGELPELALFADHAKPVCQTFRGGREQTVLAADFHKRLSAVARSEGATPFILLMATYAAFLHRISRQDDLIVAAPMAPLKPLEWDGVIGPFANTAAIRIDTSGDPSFHTLVGRVRDAVLDALDHIDVPFERVVEAVCPARSAGRVAIFRTMLALQNAPPPVVMAHGFTVRPVEADSGGSKFDMTLLLDERPELTAVGATETTLGATLHYSTDLFQPQTAAQRLSEWVTLAAAALDDPSRRISRLPLLSPALRQQMVVAWNDTAVEYPRDSAVHALFEAQVARTPAAVAVDSSGILLTYRDLDRRAERLAAVLQARGVEPGARVAIMLGRSWQFMVGILAALKAGAVYVPIDPRLPRERLRLMLDDAQPAVVVISDHETLDRSLVEERCCVEVNQTEDQQSAPGLLRIEVESDSPACVLYTSGSTGQPNGVVIPHRGIVRLVAGADYVTLEAGDRVAHVANVCFDAATFEIWGALTSGARLVIIPNDVAMSPHRLADALVDKDITTVLLTTSVFNQIARERPGAFRTVRNVLFGGEAADRDAVLRVLEGGAPQRLVNVYGPTEATTFATTYRVEQPLSDGSIPIGRPIANTTVYLLDERLELMPVGVPGELFIGGDGVALGYLNRPELTTQRFVADPFAPGGRLYRTGDLARCRPDGTIEFIGRLDNQVKIRGFRIEPGEIESALAAHPDVRHAVVIVATSAAGEKQLAAFAELEPQAAVSSTRETAPSLLRGYLKGRLPEYMVPSVLGLVDEWPLTPTGKIDRRALAGRAALQPTPASQKAAVRNALEAGLVSLWEDLLGVRPIGIRDNFFDLGGHSLLAAKMIDAVERLCRRRLPLSALFASPTIESIASAVSAQSDEGDAIVTLQPDGSRPPFFLLHGDFTGRGLYCRHLIEAVGKDRPFHVVHPHGTDRRPIPATIEAMAEDRLRAIRDRRPHGPYVLGGYCNGALVAFDIARRLVADGEHVEQIILVDPSPAECHWTRLQQGLESAPGWCSPDPARLCDWMFRLRSFWDLDASGRLDVVRSKIVRRRSTATLGAAASEAPCDPTSDYSKAIRGYLPRPYAGRLTLITSDAEAADALVATWRRVASNIELWLTAGNHSTCITTDVGSLAARLRSCLGPAPRHQILDCCPTGGGQPVHLATVGCRGN